MVIFGKYVLQHIFIFLSDEKNFINCARFWGSQIF